MKKTVFNPILFFGTEMSSYDNVVGGKLKLKGKALDVAGGVKKKKKKNKRNQDQLLQVAEDEISAGWLFQGNILLHLCCVVLSFTEALIKLLRVLNIQAMIIKTCLDS